LEKELILKKVNKAYKYIMGNLFLARFCKPYFAFRKQKEQIFALLDEAQSKALLQREDIH
jgi:hypothetical protein